MARTLSTALGRAAVAALIAELDLTPKPGLVDREHPGAHRDMDAARMEAGAYVLGDTFLALAETARDATPSQALREELGALGRRGERAMLRATGGVNTHRGALWALGLLCAGAASLGTAHDVEAVCARASAFAAFGDRFGAPRVRWRDGGALAQARRGFPAVRRVALPRLRDGRPHGASRALLALIATVDDTCLRSRGGVAGLHYARSAAARAAHCGDDDAVRRLDRAFVAAGLSPGGSADLLAAALYLDALARR